MGAWDARWGDGDDGWGWMGWMARRQTCTYLGILLNSRLRIRALLRFEWDATVYGVFMGGTTGDAV